MQRRLVFSLLLLAFIPIFAQRELVLKQIDLPHACLRWNSEAGKQGVLNLLQRARKVYASQRK